MTARQKTKRTGLRGLRLPASAGSLKRHPSLSQLAVFSRIFFVRENAIKPAFLLSFGCIYEKSCLISCGLGAAARVLGHNGPKVLLLEIILTKSSKGPKSYRLSVYCFSHFFYKFKIDSETSHVQLVKLKS